MIRLTLRTAPAVALALLALTQGAVVEAGFVSLDLDCVRGEGAFVDSESPGASSAAPSQTADLQLPQRVDVPVREAVHQSSLNVTGSGGMSPAPDQVAGSSPVAVLTTDVNRQAQLSVWLAEDGRAALPPPLSTGIFRPPRFIG